MYKYASSQKGNSHTVFIFKFENYRPEMGSLSESEFNAHANSNFSSGLD